MENPAHTHAPVISVIVPAHGRPARLAACLNALARQNIPPETYEVIVCDDGSIAALAEQIAETLAAFSARTRVTFVRQKRAGPAAARNRAASLARGRLLAFTDDDCLPANDWLAKLLETFGRRPELLVGGALRNALPDDVCATATHLIMDCAYAYQLRCARKPMLFSTSNMAMSAAGFRQLGGFSETFRLPAGEDYDFSARWQHHGGEAEFVPAAVVHHAHALSFGAYVRQHLNYGRGLVRMRQMMARRSGERLRFSPWGFYFSLVSHAWRKGDGMRAWSYAGLVVISQVVTVAGGAFEALIVRGPTPTDPAPLEPTVGRAAS